MEPKIRAIREAEQSVARIRRQIGPSEAIDRFLSRYGKIRTQKVYATHLQLYLRWLKEQGVSMTPDELIQDNLNCVYGAAPQDVKTKRKHSDLLHRYVNVYLLDRGIMESTRRQAFTAVKMFHLRNDSGLFGDIGVSAGSPETPPEALPAEDIRKVIRLLPFTTRLPALVEWQSGMEINRVLGLRWKNFEGAWKGEEPLRIELFGRKMHRRPYHSFVGRDSIELVKVWKERWKEWIHREPLPEELVFLSKRKKPLRADWVNHTLKQTARKLADQGLIKARDLRAWHSHSLRHSFRTQAGHAGVPSRQGESGSQFHNPRRRFFVQGGRPDTCRGEEWIPFATGTCARARATSR
jgi:integrase